MAHEPFKGRRPIFIGDDVTDEAVFGIMPDLGGLAFSVGRHATGVADYFDEPRDVREWLPPFLFDQTAAGRRSQNKASFFAGVPSAPHFPPPPLCASPPSFVHFFCRVGQLHPPPP